MKHYDKEIKPNRYVYHITSKVFRESILTKGLVAKTSKYLPYQNQNGMRLMLLLITETHIAEEY